MSKKGEITLVFYQSHFIPGFLVGFFGVIVVGFGVL